MENTFYVEVFMKSWDACPPKWLCWWTIAVQAQLHIKIKCFPHKYNVAIISSSKVQRLTYKMHLVKQSSLKRQRESVPDFLLWVDGLSHGPMHLLNFIPHSRGMLSCLGVQIICQFVSSLPQIQGMKYWNTYVFPPGDMPHGMISLLGEILDNCLF